MGSAVASRMRNEVDGGGACGPRPGSGAEPFANFLACTGHRVLRGAGAYWYDASPGFFLGLPSHQLLRPTTDELRALLRQQPCAGVRFSAPLDGPGKASYQIACEDRGYGLEGLSANVRSKVRRGLKRCEVTALPFADIAEKGLAADRETLARQGRAVRLDAGAWQRYWRAAASTPGMEGWGAFVGGELAAFLVSVQFDDTVELLLARSRSAHLDAYPNNALIYTVTHALLVERGVRRVTFGLESLEAVGPLDQFKFSMGFRPAPVRQRVVFHPLIGTLLRSGRLRGAVHGWAARRGAPGGFWRKAAGLLAFAEAGTDLGKLSEGIA